jgi:uncharacterized protein
LAHFAPGLVVPAQNWKVEMAVLDNTRVILTDIIYPGNKIVQIEWLSMNSGQDTAYIAFEGDRRIASGDLREVARAAKQALDQRQDASILVFDGRTSEPVDLDFRGAVADVLARLPEIPDAPAVAEDAALPIPRGPGRPKLGVVAREVTLLPRHWDWLAQQAGGASVAIRKLVEEARRTGEQQGRLRLAQESAYRFMSAMAGDKPHYEDAIRALFANDAVHFEKLIAEWPIDVRDHASMLAARAFDREPQARAG